MVRGRRISENRREVGAGRRRRQHRLRKRHDLQGPIDDAFMDSFLMVNPTGTPMNETVGKWTKSEQAHAIQLWRRRCAAMLR